MFFNTGVTVSFFVIGGIPLFSFNAELLMSFNVKVSIFSGLHVLETSFPEVCVSLLSGGFRDEYTTAGNCPAMKLLGI